MLAGYLCKTLPCNTFTVRTFPSSLKISHHFTFSSNLFPKWSLSHSCKIFTAQTERPACCLASFWEEVKCQDYHRKRYSNVLSSDEMCNVTLPLLYYIREPESPNYLSLGGLFLQYSVPDSSRQKQSAGPSQILIGWRLAMEMEGGIWKWLSLIW